MTSRSNCIILLLFLSSLTNLSSQILLKPLVGFGYVNLKNTDEHSSLNYQLYSKIIQHKTFFVGLEASTVLNEKFRFGGQLIYYSPMRAYYQFFDFLPINGFVFNSTSIAMNGIYEMNKIEFDVGIAYETLNNYKAKLEDNSSYQGVGFKGNQKQFSLISGVRVAILNSLELKLAYHYGFINLKNEENTIREIFQPIDRLQLSFSYRIEL